MGPPCLYIVVVMKVLVDQYKWKYAGVAVYGSMQAPLCYLIRRPRDMLWTLVTNFALAHRHIMVLAP